MFIIPDFIDDIIKNTVEQIKYRESINTGEVKADNDDGTYGVEISQSGKTYPNVPTAHYGETFAVGEIVIITYEYGNKEMPRIWGHAKKIAQSPFQATVDYSGSGGNPITTVTTLDAYLKTTTTAYLEGKISLSGGVGNCTRRGFKYGLTSAYGNDVHDDGDYGEGCFNRQITGLDVNQTYHYQAYVLDADGDEQVGEDKIMVTPPSFWDVSVMSYDNKFKDISGQEGSPRGLFFKSDGSKMYIVGEIEDTVFQYSLSVAWDVSTATYDNKFKDISGQEGTPLGLFFKSDGSKMYISGYANKMVFQYLLSVAWDVSTATYDNKFKDISGQEGTPHGLFFRSNGSKMYIVGENEDTVFQYSLSTAWDVSTATYDNKFKDISNEDIVPYDLFFKSDGSKMYIMGYDNDTVFQYSLSVAWDVSTATYDNKFKDISNEDIAPRGLFFKSDGSKMYVVGYINGKVFQYS